MASSPRYGDERHAIGLQAAEEGGGLPLGGRADISALGVQDQHVIAGTSPRIRSSAAQPADPKASKNATLIFTALANLGRRLEDAAREALDACRVRVRPSGRASGCGSMPKAQRRPERGLTRPQPLQRRAAHAIVAPAGAAMGTGWSVGACAALRRSANGLSELAA